MSRRPILLVHDDADAAALIRLSLVRAGFTDVVTAPDGEQGLEAALRLLPRLVIADVHMPGLDGFQLLQVLRRETAAAGGIPVVLVSSSFRDPAAARLAGDLGAAAYVDSPCEGDALVDAVHQALAAPRTPAAPSGPTSGAAARVLVVEDDPDVAAVVQATLRRRGYETCGVGNRGDARRHLLSGDWDLVILDHHLPGGTGLELLRDVRAAGAGIAAVVLSAHVDLETAVSYMRAGADDVLHKPFQSTVLLGSVGRALERRALAIRASQFRARLEAARLSEARCRSLVELSRDVIWRLDAEGRIVDTSPAAPYLIGCRRSDVLGRPAAEWFEPESAQRLREALVLDPSDREIELDLRGVDGPVPLSVRAQPLREGGVLAGHWLVGRDLRRQRRLSRDLAESAERASVSRLIAGMSHEFSGVIGAVLGFVTLQRRGAPVDQETLSELQRAAVQAADLLSTIRLLSWAEGPTDRVAPERLTARLLEEQREAFTAAGVELTVEVAPGLPAIPGSESGLLRALAELCSNARHAAAAGPGGAVQVRVSRTPDHRILWTVTDNGAGLNPEAIRHAFEPFYTTKGALGGTIIEGKARGTGLGLSVARAVARAHGGELELAPAAQVGTAARLRIPTVRATTREQRGSETGRGRVGPPPLHPQ